MLRGAGEVWLSPHDRPLEVHELHDAVAGADAVVTLLHDRVDEALLEAAGPQLRCVANVAVGFDNIDVAAATERGVVVTNTPGVLVDATADLAMALILAVTRRVGEGERFVRARRAWSWDLFFMLGSGLAGKTLGVVGLGAIGRAVAARARAFGLKIVYAAPRAAPAEVESALAARHLALDELLQSSDIVTLHCPLTPQTRHLIDGPALERMPPTAFLINTARGPVVDEDALVRALRGGALAGAGLDVYENEPEVHPGLLELENVVLLPHLGSATLETRTAMATLAAENAVAVLERRRPPTPVNPEVL
jgi:glyoxylate reductase